MADTIKSVFPEEQEQEKSGPKRRKAGFLRPYASRYIILGVLIFAVFVMIGFRLYDMQIVQADEYLAKADSKRTKTISLTGKRGTVYDCNMTPLAYDRECYNLQFYRDPSKTTSADRAAYTQAIIETIKIIEDNGKEIVNEFWLARDENGEWQFDTGTENAVTAAKREKQWRDNFYLSSVPVEQLFDTLCRNYVIPEKLSEEEKIKVLSVWQKSRMYNFLSQPVTIAEDVGLEVVAKVEALSMELTGMSIQQSYCRVYPKGEIAAHVIGYTSKISGETTMAEYRSKGYSNDSTVGQAGIEYAMEDQLTAQISYRKGQKVVEINNQGKIIRTISYQAPVDGNDIILTIDSRLQSVMQQALADNIASINKEQERIMNTTNWRKKNQDELYAYEQRNMEVNKATSGACVAMDPNTGTILGMCSYPTFNLTAFNGGKVDVDYWIELNTDVDNPLYNRAISARDTPGSCFKMCTSLAGLMEGTITLDTRINDEGKFTKTGDETNQPTCWASPAVRKAQHQNQTVIQGLKNSCNYFFYTVGFDLGIDKLVKWAASLGLTSKTNVELPAESTSFVGNQLMLFDSARGVNNQYTSKPYFASFMIKKSLKEIAADLNTEYDNDTLDKISNLILHVVSDTPDKSDWPKQIRNILMEFGGLTTTYIANNFLVNLFYSYINDLRWTPSETIMAAIGQSITQVTPVAVARYVSAVCNGGTVYDAHIINKIVSPSGMVVLEKEPVIANRITGADAYLAAIQEGMKEVTSTENDGTAAAHFAKSTAKIAAKTGTAQRSDIDIENNSWLVTYAPYDSTPEIVVVVYIQNGYAGAYSSATAISTIEAYLAQEAKTDNNRVRPLGTLSE